MPDVTIRPAALADAAAIGAVHVSVWRATYDDIAPQVLKDRLDTHRGAPYWSKELETLSQSSGIGDDVLVADCDGICGFVRYGSGLGITMDPWGEIKHLYVSLDQQGKGVGAQLLRAALLALKSAGVATGHLAVVKQNVPARAFYEKQGGQVAGEFLDTGPLWRSENVIMQWSLKDVQ